MSPLPEQESPIVLTAWGRTLEVDSADDERVDEFLRSYTNGPQTPEKGAACVGVTTTGRRSSPADDAERRAQRPRQPGRAVAPAGPRPRDFRASPARAAGRPGPARPR